MDTLCKQNFMFLGRTLFEKNAMITSNIQSCTIVLINNFEILQVSIIFLSDTVRPRKLKFVLYINPYGYSMQNKFLSASYHRISLENCATKKYEIWFAYCIHMG